VICSDKTITTWDLLKVLWRALLIQASWSFERMQSLGFAYALEPVLRKLYPEQAEYESRLRYHMEYFNTQPYLASFILGAVARLEQDRAAGCNTTADIQCIKTTLMAPLGALGDSFFWGGLKPLAAVVATALLFLGAWWAPLLFLIVYNIGHLTLRTAVLFWGYASRGDAMELMNRFRFTKIAKLFKVMSLAVIGGIIGMLPAWRSEFKPTIDLPGFVLALSGMGMTLLLIAILRKNISPLQMMLVLAACCLALAYAGVI
jgi:mannose/fructose/N-acetylgalactosamine-specific phosphotransferase system component IID